MVRRWLVPPDFEAQTPSGVVAAVSLDALIGGLAEAATILHRSGGHLSVVQQRTPGMIDGEYVTLGAVIEWRDRTDAKPQAEPVESLVPSEAVVAEEQRIGQALADEVRANVDPEIMAAVDERVEQMRPQLADDEEVDESSIPVALRG